MRFFKYKVRHYTSTISLQFFLHGFLQSLSYCAVKFELLTGHMFVLLLNVVQTHQGIEIVQILASEVP